MARSDVQVAVFYHNFSVDSGLAMYAINEHYNDRSIAYINKATKTPLPNITQCEIAFMLGIVDHDLIKTLCKRCVRTIIFDRNYTNSEYLEDLQQKYSHVEVIFELENTISKMVWDFLHLRKSEEIQWALDHAEDAENWNWNLENSKQIQAGMRAYLGFINPDENPDLFDKIRNIDIDEILDIGIVEWEKVQRGIDRSLERPKFWIKLGNYNILTIFLPMNKYRNWVGHILAEESERLGSPPCGAVASIDGTKDRVKISLRSKGEFNSAELAERYGGGGHKNSACIRMSSRDFNNLKLDKRPRRRY